MQMKENQPLAPFTTFGIGGPARWFVEAASEDEIVEAAAWARGRGVPLFVLGGGSNLLVADEGFDGLVLRVGLTGIRVYKNDHPNSEPGEPWGYDVAAGEDWDRFVERAVSDGCSGIECLAGIPGTVGGTPVQNVGAYGQEVSSTIDSVRAFDLQEGVFRLFTNGECGFGYRKSRFNSLDRGRYIVTGVSYGLWPGGPPLLAYADVKSCFEGRGETPTLSEVAAAVRAIRQTKGMLLVEGDPDCRSAGSFFKNPAVTADVAEQVRAFAESAGLALRAYPTTDGLVKIPAAWLIEQAGFKKGLALGAAGISSRHTLALVNLGGATAKEIVALADRVVAGVEERFGIRLEMEPVMLGVGSRV
jgi:UDP-N-acetylmuramate dehydrogenase